MVIIVVIMVIMVIVIVIMVIMAIVIVIMVIMAVTLSSPSLHPSQMNPPPLAAAPGLRPRPPQLRSPRSSLRGSPTAGKGPKMWKKHGKNGEKSKKIGEK
jgi:hypothetical protein